MKKYFQMIGAASWIKGMRSPDKSSWTRTDHLGQALIKNIPRVPVYNGEASGRKFTKKSEGLDKKLEIVAKKTEEQYGEKARRALNSLTAAAALVEHQKIEVEKELSQARDGRKEGPPDQILSFYIEKNIWEYMKKAREDLKEEDQVIEVPEKEWVPKELMMEGSEDETEEDDDKESRVTEKGSEEEEDKIEEEFGATEEGERRYKRIRVRTKSESGIEEARKKRKRIDLGDEGNRKMEEVLKEAKLSRELEEKMKLS